MDVSIQLYSTAAGARWTGGWVGPTIGLEFVIPVLERLFDSSQASNPHPILTGLFRFPLGSYIAHFTLWKRCPFTSGHSWGNFSAQSGHQTPISTYLPLFLLKTYLQLNQNGHNYHLTTTSNDNVTHHSHYSRHWGSHSVWTRKLNAFGHLRRHGQSRIPAQALVII